jgi:two-component system sensor histidine kinase HydH
MLWGSRRLAGIALLVGLAILLLDVGLWLVYGGARRSLEAELARRLETVVAVLARLVDPSLVERAATEAGVGRLDVADTDALFAVPATDSLRSLLRDIAADTDLANIRLADASGIDFLDLAAGPHEAGDREALDPAGVRAALAGVTAHSELYRSGAEYLMAGYAPVRDASGEPIAVVVIEADARFFAALHRLRLAMVASAAVSIALLAGLGVGFARMQASLQRAEAAVQRSESLAAMGRMAAGIAHEIRNPLAIIKATAMRLRRRYEDPQSPDEKFAYIDDEVERLDGILSGYLQFARDEPARLVPLDLAALVDRSLRLAAPEFEPSGVRLQADLPPACPVRADAARIQQVILNVVLNAVQAMPQGGKLRVRLVQTDGRVRLSFEDTGPGIDAAVRGRLFEPFVTTKEKGSGLGLAVARRIVEEHHGGIEARAGATGGTCIEIVLPAA